MRYFLALLVCFAWLPAAAQQTGDDETQTQERLEQNRAADDARRQAEEDRSQAFQQQVAEWERILDETDERLRSPDIRLTELEETRGRLRDLRSTVLERREPATERAGELEGLLEALGPAPEEGEPPEAEAAAQERGRLQDQLARAQARVGVLDVIVARIDADLARVTAVRSRTIATRLLERGPQIWNGDTWSRAWHDALRVGTSFWDSPRAWWTNPAVTRRLGSAAPIVALLAILAIIAISIQVRRGLMRRYGRRRDLAEPNYAQQFLAACVEGLAHGAVPMAAAGTAYLLLLAGGVIIGLFGTVLTALLWATLLYFLVTGIARAALSPKHPRWRLPDIPDNNAAYLGRIITTLTVLVALNTFLNQATADFYISLELLAVYDLFMNGAIAAGGILILRGSLWRRRYGQETGSWIWRFALFVGRVVLVLVPVMMALGYHRLADALTMDIIASAAVVGASAAGFALLENIMELIEKSGAGWSARLRDAIGLKEKGSSAIGFLISVLAELVLLLVTLFLLAIVWSVDLDSVVDLMTSLWTGVSVGEETFALRDVLIVIVVFLLLAVLVKRIQYGVDSRVRVRTRMDAGLRNAVRAGIGYTGMIIAALIAISAAGLDISNLALIAGALSVGIGFGLQAIVSNFVSGIILLAERPIKEGDWIEVDGYEGHVKRISVRSTEIVTFSRASVVVPNSTLISTSVVNWMHKDITGRTEIPVGVAYGSDTDLVKETLLNVAREHPKILDDPAPYVLFMNFGDSALEFELRCYLGEIDNKLSVSSDLRFGVDRAFREAGIAIPFPQRDLHIKEAPEAGENPAGGQSAGAAANKRSRKKDNEANGEGDSADAD